MLAPLLFAALAGLVNGQAAQAPSFVPPSSSPTTANTTTNVGASNKTLTNGPVVPGKVFDRFIQIWLENTDFADAASSATFQNLSTQGILLSQYYAVTHPSEPNYCATVGGDFFGMHDDALYNLPGNVSTVVDLLDAKNISWGEYQENLPDDGFQGFNYSSTNYLNSSAPDYVYYVRKHNPLILYTTVTSNPNRISRIRNFNDLAADLAANTLPQWSFITPNMVNDGHDTNIDFASKWLEYFLVPLLQNPAFNNNKTLILLTFDENEHAGINNNVYTLLLGNAVPQSKRNTTDTTYYTHYSALSSVQANWALGSLGRQDTNKTVSNVFALVANTTGYKNVDVTGAAIPLTNSSGNYPGALNSQLWIPILSPDANATGAGGGKVHLSPNTTLGITLQTVGTPQNLTASNASAIVPASSPLPGDDPGQEHPSNGTSGGSGSGSGGKSGAGKVMVGWGVMLGMGVVLLL